MDCHRVRDLLFETADSDLPDVVREELGEHLAQCPSCANMAAAVEGEVEALRALSRVTAPADFLQRIHARLDEPKAQGRKERRGGGLFGGRRFIEAAGLAVAAMLVVVIYHASLKEAPEVKPRLSESPVPVLQAKPEVEFSAPPPEQPVIREEMGRSAAGSRQPASPRVRTGSSEGSLAPGHLSLTLTLKPPSSPSASGVEKKVAVASPHRRDSGPMALRPVPRATPVGEGQVEGGDGDRKHTGDVESRRARESVPSVLQDAREESAVPPAPEPSPGPRIHTALDEIRRIVVESGGVVVSTPPPPATELEEVLVVADVPPETLTSLLDRLRFLGEIRADAGSPDSRETRTRIRLSLKVIPLKP